MNTFALRLCGMFSVGLILAPAAFAASTVDLAVRGTITPSACTPGLSQGGQIDFGKIPARDLSADSPTRLPTVILKLTVNCAAPTLFALRSKDNRAGSAYLDDGYTYGMGLINGNEKVGGYLLTLRDPVSSTAQLSTLTSVNGGVSWWNFPQGVFLVWHNLSAFGNNDSGVAAPMPLLDVTSDLYVESRIAPANGLTLDQQVPLDGAATLDLIYL